MKELHYKCQLQHKRFFYINKLGGSRGQRNKRPGNQKRLDLRSKSGGPRLYHQNLS